MFLGSSLGNFDRVESTKFLSSFPLIPGSSDTLLLGLDGRNDKALIERAYNDPEGYTAKFILGGLDVLQETLDAEPDGGGSLIDRFEYVGRYNVELGELSFIFSIVCGMASTVLPHPRSPRSILPGKSHFLYHRQFRKKSLWQGDRFL